MSNQNETLNYFLVKLRIHAGEYEKSTIHAVIAANHTDAFKCAVEDESHNDLDFEDDGKTAVDGNWEFSYRCLAWKEVSKAEFDEYNRLTNFF